MGVARWLGGVVVALWSGVATAKVPATVNIGIGPTVGTVMRPGAEGPAPVSVGLALVAEGWVSGKTLHSKKVMKRVPRKYKGMVKSMDDLHVVPLPAMVVPDQVLLMPLNEEKAGIGVQAVGWTPISMAVVHKVKPMHVQVSAAPRVAWVGLRPDSESERDHLGWLGLDIAPEVQSAMTRKVGFAAGGNIGPGLALGASDRASAPWLWADAYLRLQLRFPIEVDM